MFCGNCGAPREPDFRFCGSCGAPLDGAPPAEPSADWILAAIVLAADELEIPLPPDDVAMLLADRAWDERLDESTTRALVRRLTPALDAAVDDDLSPGVAAVKLPSGRRIPSIWQHHAALVAASGAFPVMTRLLSATFNRKPNPAGRS